MMRVPFHAADLARIAELDVDDFLDFAAEYGDVVLGVSEGDRPISEVNDVIEQWRRSALVLRDGALCERLEQERTIILEGSET